MKEVNCIIDSMIKLINSKVIGEIIIHSGYFEEVEDISNQLSSENTMVFDVYVDLDVIFGEPMGINLDNIEKDLEIDGIGLSEKSHYYMDIAVEDIVEEIKDHLNIVNVTSSFSINQLDSGISAFIYLYFGEYYLNEADFH